MNIMLRTLLLLSLCGNLSLFFKDTNIFRFVLNLRAYNVKYNLMVRLL